MDDEIESVRIEIEMTRTQIREDAETLGTLGNEIRTSMHDDSEYVRNEAFFKQLRAETRVTQDYIDKVKKLIKLHARYLKLEKKRDYEQRLSRMP